MLLHSLTLHSFRNYTQKKFVFADTTTLIIGPNGSGKTNILEAIHVLTNGKSFRDSDEDLITYNKTWWRIEGKLDGLVREVRYQPEKSRSKELLIDGVSKGRFTYKQQIPVVLFEPDDLQMIHSTPSVRRAFIDGLVQKVDPSYRTTLRRFERVLLQRNNILKSGLPSSSMKDQLFAWDISLAELTVVMMLKRRQYIEQLNVAASERYSHIASKTHTLELIYETNLGDEVDQSSIVSALHRSFEHDRLRGATSVGPHHDDILFQLNHKPAKQTASRGEVRTIILTLKLLEAELYKTIFSTPPILLLDDVFSELDETRRTHLLDSTKNMQLILTTTNADAVPGRLEKHIQL